MCVFSLVGNRALHRAHRVTVIPARVLWGIANRMLSGMRRRPSGPVPDVFETFAHRVDTPEDAPMTAPAPATVARSAGITVGLMVLTSLAFVAGAWVAGRSRPDLVYANLLWEGIAMAAWSIAWGAFAAMAVLAAGVVAVGLPWMRRQRDARSTSTSAP